MAYVNPVLIQLVIIITILSTLLHQFKKDTFKELSLSLLFTGLSIVLIGLIFHYLSETPLQTVIVALTGQALFPYISMIFYVPAGIFIVLGFKLWFGGVLDTRREIRLRREAERLLAENSKLTAQVLDNSHQGILIFDRNFTIKLTNNRFLELLDIPPALGMPGKTYQDIIDVMTERGEYGSAVAETVHDEWIELIQNTDYLHFQRKRPNGVILEIEARWIAGIGLLCTYTDVTLQANAEMELTRRKEQFQHFTESASDWMWELDKNMAISYISELGLNLSGRPSQDVIGLPFDKLPAVFENADHWKNLIATAGEYRSFVDQQTGYVQPDGTKLYFSLSGKPIFNHSGEFQGYRGVGRDITARKLVEEQLYQSQKMEAIGRLTGGVAHDFNNLLAILLGNTELLRESIPAENSDIIPILDNMERATLRGAELTQQLLAYSRKQRLRPSSVDLVDGLSGIVSLIGRSLGEDIDITLHHGDSLWHAHTDPGQLENAILNLANNARDAMPSGGTLLIEMENHRQSDDRSEAYNFPAGDYVAVSVTDTGTGIAPDVIEKVFEPFFTTKEIGKGTGLGLSMVFGFAKQSNGHVCIDSKQGVGTTVTLFLPRASDEKTQPAEQRKEDQPFFSL